jgi:hypothetical protein
MSAHTRTTPEEVVSYECPKYKDMTEKQKAWADNMRNEQSCPPWCPHATVCPHMG